MSEARMNECWKQWKDETWTTDREAFFAAYEAGQNDPAPWQVAAIEREAGARALAEVRSTIGAYQENGVWAFDQAVACIERARAAEAREGRSDE